MDKRVLRTVISGMVVGQEVGVTFRGAQTALSGAFKVLNRKTGRGKGGSLLAVLQSLGDGTTVTIGTPDNEAVLNVSVAGTQFGSASESDEPRTYPTSEARALALKEQMRVLVGDAGVGRQVRLTSAIAPEFNGLFTVNRAQLERGRYGQIHLFLTNAGGSTLEVWTYRHSTAIDSFEIVAAPSA
jgi:hypothetical protein